MKTKHLEIYFDKGTWWYNLEGDSSRYRLPTTWHLNEDARMLMCFDIKGAW